MLCGATRSRLVRVTDAWRFPRVALELSASGHRPEAYQPRVPPLVHRQMSLDRASRPAPREMPGRVVWDHSRPVRRHDRYSEPGMRRPALAMTNARLRTKRENFGSACLRQSNDK